MVNANDFHEKNDSDILNLAIKGRDADGIVLIPPRKQEIDPERSFWLLDEAVCLPENTTVILQNCRIKLSDRCRDNFFRTDNCGLGVKENRKISNVSLIGEGYCLLEGAEHPRATGDGSKILADPCPYEVDDLIRYADWIPEERRTPETIEFWDRHDHSYGTDAGKSGESQYGDWRGIGVLFANTEHFTISGITLKETHGWGISLEACSYGDVRNITFDSCMSKMINGLRTNMENQDGIDVRNGCHDIIIHDIYGETGDDVIALTAIASDDFKEGGSIETTHVMHSDWSRRDRDIHNITIRNVQAYSGLCLCVRILPAFAHIWNVTIDNIIDTCPEGHTHWATICIGDDSYGKNAEDGARGIAISNVICNADSGIEIATYLKDSVISNVVNMRPGTPAISVKRENGLNNVKISNVITANDV